MQRGHLHRDLPLGLQVVEEFLDESGRQDVVVHTGCAEDERREVDVTYRVRRRFDGRQNRIVLPFLVRLNRPLQGNVGEIRLGG